MRLDLLQRNSATPTGHIALKDYKVRYRRTLINTSSSYKVEFKSIYGTEAHEFIFPKCVNNDIKITNVNILQ